MDDGLARLMGGTARLKLLRLFFFNPEELFEKESIAHRLKISKANAAKEAGFLARTGLVRKRVMYKEQPKKKQGRIVKKKVQGFVLNPEFPHLTQLRQFMVETAMLAGREVGNRLRPTGKLRLVITSGVFMQMWESRIDILIVGEEINHEALAGVIKQMEAELGRELRYAAFTTQDFYYRRSVQDKLIRDVIDYPHEKVIDRIGI
jgi:hypothetical protein